jgi:hypothetical protein
VVKSFDSLIEDIKYYRGRYTSCHALRNGASNSGPQAIPAHQLILALQGGGNADLDASKLAVNAMNNQFLLENRSRHCFRGMQHPVE